jgi:hypothetical protein
MDWNDKSAAASAHGAWEPAQLPPEDPAPSEWTNPASTSAFGGLRRTVATVALVVGLLAVGGTAVVLAADPSGSPTPNATTEPSTGAGGSTAPGTTTPKTHTGNCPNMGGTGSGRSGGSTAPSTTGPTSSPAL